MTRPAKPVAARVWRAGQLVTADLELSQLTQYLADPANLVWVDLGVASGELLSWLVAELQFSSHAVEDAMSPHERPKAVWHDRQLFVQAYLTRLAENGGYGSRLRKTRVSAFVVANGLITVRSDELFELSELVELWDDEPELISYGVGGLLHGLLDLIGDGHYAVTAELDEGIEGLENLLFAEQLQTREVSQSAYRLRRELSELRRLTLPMRDVVNTVIRHGHEMGWSEQLRYYYDDLYDHVQREAEWTEALRDLVASIFETNLALNDMRLNEVMKKLSGWAAIIAVPTLITGWFGMNVPYLGFSQPLGLWLAIGIMVISVVGLFVTFKRYDWI